MDQTPHLKTQWEVIRQDWSDNKFRTPLPCGCVSMDESIAKWYAQHMQDKGHHQDYEARVAIPNDPEILN